MLALSLMLVTFASAQADETVERRLFAMGTALMLRVSAVDRPTALAASEAALRALESTERRLSTHREDSELSVLNAAPVGHWLELSASLARDLALAQQCHELTLGGFDATLGHPRAIEFSGTRARRLEDATLDAGGFGKGVGLDAALAAARRAGAAGVMMDLGGQIAIFGESLEVRVAHPVRRARTVASVPLSRGSVATSGQGEQPGHIRDPRTGDVVPAYGSVTVTARSAALADCLATGLFVLGGERALAVSRQLDEVEVLVVERRVLGVRLAGATP